MHVHRTAPNKCIPVFSHFLTRGPVSHCIRVSRYVVYIVRSLARRNGYKFCIQHRGSNGDRDRKIHRRKKLVSGFNGMTLNLSNLEYEKNTVKWAQLSLIFSNPYFFVFHSYSNPQFIQLSIFIIEPEISVRILSKMSFFCHNCFLTIVPDTESLFEIEIFSVHVQPRFFLCWTSACSWFIAARSSWRKIDRCSRFVTSKILAGIYFSISSRFLHSSWNLYVRNTRKKIIDFRVTEFSTFYENVKKILGKTMGSPLTQSIIFFCCNGNLDFRQKFDFLDDGAKHK